MITRGALLDWLVMIALVIVWGSAFAFLKVAVAEWHPAWVVCARLVVASATLLLVLALRRETLPPPSDRTWTTYGLIGVMGLGVPFLCFAWAATELPSSVLAICNGTTPVFTALLAHFLIAGERLTGRRVLGVALGVAGFLALVAPDLLEQGPGQGSGGAQLAAVGGAVLYAVANIVIKRAPDVGAATSAFLMCLGGAVSSGIIALVWAGPPTGWSTPAAGAIVFLAVFPTALATIGYVWLIRRRGAVFTSLSVYLAPIWATLLGVVLLSEAPTVTDYLALVLILAGVAIANLKGRTVDRPPLPAGAVSPAAPAGGPRPR
jgi:drug/metabolite transporter (DMT)-like permease